MNRRRFLGACAAGLLATGCDFSLRHGVFNACGGALPPELREHPLVVAAWRDLDATKVWDVHCHVFGNGDSGSGLWFNPRMDQMWRAAEYLKRVLSQRELYRRRSRQSRRELRCTAVVTGQRDGDRLSRAAVRLRLGARRRRCAAAGSLDVPCPTTMLPDSRNVTPNAAWAASIHPYDPSALDRWMRPAAARDKWLPSAQGIDPADARCDRFYASWPHCESR
jgi:mannonate dehydratase